MTRVAFIADSHFSEHSRFDECIRLHDEFAAKVAEMRVDLVCHAGDVFDAKSSPVERKAVADWLRKVTETCPVVIVRGNHDAIGDIGLFSRLRTRHPVIVEEAASVHHIGPIAVAAMAWPRKSELLAAIGNVPQEQAAAIGAEALRAVIAGMGTEMAEHDGPRVFLAHAMVGGSVTSTGQPLVGCDHELGLADIASSRAHIAVVGHIHKGQDWSHGGMPITYPGSPRRTAFGELERKGFIVASFDHFDGELTCEESPGVRWHCEDWEFIELSATPMVLIDAAFDDTLSWAEQDVTGAEVRLRVSTAADAREAARHAANELREELLRRGAVMVKVEEQVDASVRARAPEVATATTLHDKLRAYWKAKGIELGDREPRVLGRLGEVTT